MPPFVRRNRACREFLMIGLVLRKEWLTWPAFILLMAAGWQPEFALDVAKNLCAAGAIAVVMARFGLLAMCAFGLSLDLFFRLPPTLDTAAWHFGAGLAGAVVVLVLAAGGFYTATGGRLFREGFFGDD